MEVKDKVLETLKNAEAPLKGGEISEMSGLDKKAVDKAIKQLKTENLIESPKRCYYAAR